MNRHTIAIAASLLAAVLTTSHARAQQAGGINFQELFETLDANSDLVIERGEVPESGKAAFDRLKKLADKNKDGKIDREEYREALIRMRDNMGGGGGQAAQTFEGMDTDKDGKLTTKEWKGFAPFARVDADGDGFISKEELTKFRSQAANPGQIAQRLKAMDKNGDGKISREEFTGPPALFDRLDRNGDGVIEESEIRQIAPADAAQAKKAARAAKKAAAAKPAPEKAKPAPEKPPR